MEDEESLRQVTCECLTANGYNVLQAGRGNQAIDVAEQYKGPIALIVSDVVLPDMSRPSVATKVRARRRYRAGHYQRTKNSRRCDERACRVMVDLRAKKMDPKIAHTLTYMTRVLIEAFAATNMQKELESLRQQLQTKTEKP